MTYQILHGDCIEEMRRMVDAGVKVDSVVTDPPYHLTSIVKRFGADNAAPAKVGKTGVYARSSSGFMGKKWDGGDIAFDPDTWRLCYDLLKPGGHLVTFGGSRTHHRIWCAVEDAGFEVRDTVMWLYGTGFPKSHDVSKGIDKAAGKKRKVIAPPPYKRGKATGRYSETRRVSYDYDPQPITAPATEAAEQWQGWGTALKPAHEPILLARKPLDGTVAANVQEHGTGAINVDGCRVGVEGGTTRSGQAEYPQNADGTEDRSECWARTGHQVESINAGRWPANVCHDGSEKVMEAFGDSAKFFYCAKASKKDRGSSKHPTVKPVSLMQWLVRMVTPPGGMILDPFAGSGATGEAAILEGFSVTLIEREDEYVVDIQERMRGVSGAVRHRSRL